MLLAAAGLGGSGLRQGGAAILGAAFCSYWGRQPLLPHRGHLSFTGLGRRRWDSSETPWDLERPQILCLCDVNPYPHPRSPSVTLEKGLEFRDTTWGHECGFFCFPAVCSGGSCSASLGYKGEAVVRIQCNHGKGSVCSHSLGTPNEWRLLLSGRETMWGDPVCLLCRKPVTKRPGFAEDGLFMN